MIEANKLPPVFFLMGPTAAGKTELAIRLRSRLPVEIISVDSALVYRGMDIGTAKPTEEELQRAPHRLIDIRDPADPYSAAEFCRDALREMTAIINSGRIPLLVGGTMLYFKSLLDGMADMPAADADVRQRIVAEAEIHGWSYIHAQLAKVDPESAARIHPNHSQRLCRALEVYRASGTTMTQWRNRQCDAGAVSLQRRYRLTQLAMAPRFRATLHQRINKRFELMLEQGLVEEVRKLFLRGDLHHDLPAIKAVGYRQVWEYLNGNVTREHMIEKGKAATRQLAKRQLTWLRNWQGLNWIYTEKENGYSINIEEIVAEALNFMS